MVKWKVGRAACPKLELESGTRGRPLTQQAPFLMVQLPKQRGKKRLERIHLKLLFPPHWFIDSIS